MVSKQQGTFATRISRELNLPERGTAAILALIDEGATVPFMARYRKEASGGLDEVQIRAIVEGAERARALDKRRESILTSLKENGHLDAQLSAQVQAASTLQALEDLYLPFKPKRQTRAEKARQKGLAPLAESMWQQGTTPAAQLAAGYVSPSKDVADVEAALSGARDICAERLANKAELRQRLRREYEQQVEIGVGKTPKFRTQVTKFDQQVGMMPQVSNMPSHRWLACSRGEAEGVLRLSFDYDSEQLQAWVHHQLQASQHRSWSEQSELWVKEAFQRLLVPGAKSELRRLLDEQAEQKAIDVFATNLQDLLLAAPLGAHSVLGIDPGQRTGCKCTLLDASGKLLAYDTIFLVKGEAQKEKAKGTLARLLKLGKVTAIAVGNGTHGRETETFVKQLLAESAANDDTPYCVSVSETGASVYSASEVARREFPELDVSYRGAVNIARRLQDPLAELVKIDPKSIGVGQYQHDMDASRLGARLDHVVESCVNSVGVDLNTASPELLSRVSGLGPKLSARIVDHRHECGHFKTRKELLKVKGLGAKAFEQAAGFLRIAGGKNPLDNTAVHPERYALVDAIAKKLGSKTEGLIGDEALLKQVCLADYETDEVGQYTLTDILAELTRPGRDPRADFAPPSFAEGITKLDDVEVGMQLSGVVTNVAAFGAFVDIGVHQDGLVHISKLSREFVKDPHSIVHVGEQVRVEVLEVDRARGRISLARMTA